VRALTKGWWLLLDEVNLAPPDVLERLASLLDAGGAAGGGGLLLAERGDGAPLARHPDFRLLAAMNPATDAGKRDLPPGLRDRFAELAVAEPAADGDLHAVAAAVLAPAGPAASLPLDAVVAFYRDARAAAADGRLADGGGAPPPFNLRTLCRALEYAAAASRAYGLARALRDGVDAAFGAPLEPGSRVALAALADARLPPAPRAGLPAEPAPVGTHVAVGDYWLPRGPHQPVHAGAAGAVGGFVVTPTVAASLSSLARALALGRHPVLLQGPTAAGKTSLVLHLAAATGHALARVNNHDATDVADYVGGHRAGPDGALAFVDGPLLHAVRTGSWILLDELNLAPSAVLEALNRLLDGNRELHVPETDETVRAHPSFMLFATQNPAGAYGGRKPLSRALRSRFLEVDVGGLPDGELADVVAARCGVPPSHAARLVAVQRALERSRAGGDAFAGRRALVTPRDLFRWADRAAAARTSGLPDLAAAGFALLGERLRDADARRAVADTITTIVGAAPDMDAFVSARAAAGAEALAAALAAGSAAAGPGGPLAGADRLAWTPTLARAYAITDAALDAGEPVLLVGDTGSGKTTAAALAAALRGLDIVTVSCSRHTEAADFVGGYRPVR
jgi:midasin